MSHPAGGLAADRLTCAATCRSPSVNTRGVSILRRVIAGLQSAGMPEDDMQDTEAPEDAANRAEAGNSLPSLCLVLFGAEGKLHFELQSQVDQAA